MKKELTGLLFDNDGVLIDSMPGALRAWVKWGEVYHPGFALTPEFHGRRASDIVKDMVTPEEFQASYDYINLLEIAESASTRPLPGTLEFLAQLPAGHWNIVTGANPELAKVRLESRYRKHSLLPTMQRTASLTRSHICLVPQRLESMSASVRSLRMRQQG